MLEPMDVFAEYERKLDAPSGFELPAFDGDELKPRSFTSIYYDTPGLGLSRARITLRRRVEEGENTWQLKLPRADDRLELSASGGPEAPPRELARLLIAYTRHATLAPIAELRTRRRGELVRAGSSAAEVTIDEVTVMEALRVAAEFVEIEVELKSGPRGDVEQIVRRLEEAGASSGDSLPKLFRTLRMPERDADRPATRDGFARLRAMLDEQLAVIIANDPGTRLGSDPESLHDMRVAVRRSRALLRAGRKLVLDETGPLQAELRWVGEALGSVRDLDVMVSYLRLLADSLEPDERLAAEALIDKLALEREAAQAKLVETLESERYLTLLDRFEAALAALQPAHGAPELGSLLRGELSRLRRSVKALGAEPSDAELHEQRKRGKRARYMAELAGNERVAARAKRFQDILGEHQDAVIAQARLRSLASAATPLEAFAAGRLVEREQQRKTRARARWRKAWRAVDRSA